MSASERLLDLHDRFGREAMGAAVDVAAEGHAVVIQHAGVGQAEHLIAAGIGQDGTVPGHEVVQTAHLLHQTVAGPQVEMIGVGEDELGLQFVQVAGLQRLDVGQGAHRREGGHVDGAVGRMIGAKTRCAALFGKLKLEMLTHALP